MPSEPFDPRQQDRVVIGRFDDPQLLPARQLQARVYKERNFLDDVTVLDDATDTIVDPWLHHGVHFGLDRDGEAVGHARLIVPSDAGLPSDKFVTEAPPERAITREVSSLVARPGFGSAFRLTKQLYRSMYHYSMDNDIDRWIAVVEESLFRVLSRIFKFPCNRIGPNQEYMDSQIFPVHLHIPTVTKSLLEDGDEYFTAGANPDSVARTLSRAVDQT